MSTLREQKCGNKRYGRKCMVRKGLGLGGGREIATTPYVVKSYDDFYEQPRAGVKPALLPKLPFFPCPPKLLQGFSDPFRG